jgi:CubicO group peptidase (beta-lactamase class C family)
VPGLDAAREIARAAMEELGVPGLAFGVLSEGEEEVACLGVTNLESPLEITPDTLFQTGSIAKTYLAAAVLRLVEQGRLELDEPVRRYLRQLRLADEDVAARVTMRHLLTHTGGWVGDIFEDFGRGDDALAGMVERVAEVPQLTPLGEVWSYNNAGFDIAGRVLEVVTGKTFEEAMAELVLEPLGAELAFYFPEDVMTHRFAVGHTPTGEDGEPPNVARDWWIGRSSHPAGGLVQSLTELLRYARFAFDGQPLLTPASYAELVRPQVPVGGNVDAVGLAWMLRRIEDVQTVAHGGGTNGQASVLAVVPERQFALGVLTNHAYGGVVIERLEESVFESYLGVRPPVPVSRDLEAERLAEYAGRYSAWMADAVLEAKNGGLELQLIPTRSFPKPDSPLPPAPPLAQLWFYGDDAVFASEGLWKGTKAEFLRGQDGTLAWLRLGGRVYAPAQSS